MFQISRPNFNGMIQFLFLFSYSYYNWSVLKRKYITLHCLCLIYHQQRIFSSSILFVHRRYILYNNAVVDVTVIVSMFISIITACFCSTWCHRFVAMNDAKKNSYRKLSTPTTPAAIMTVITSTCEDVTSSP